MYLEMCEGEDKPKKCDKESIKVVINANETLEAMELKADSTIDTTILGAIKDASKIIAIMAGMVTISWGMGMAQIYYWTTGTVDAVELYGDWGLVISN